MQGVTDIILDNNLPSPLGKKDSFIVTQAGKWVTIVLQGSQGEGKTARGNFLLLYMLSRSQMKKQNYEPKWQPLKGEGTSLEKDLIKEGHKPSRKSREEIGWVEDTSTGLGKARKVTESFERNPAFPQETQGNI